MTDRVGRHAASRGCRRDADHARSSAGLTRTGTGSPAARRPGAGAPPDGMRPATWTGPTDARPLRLDRAGGRGDWRQAVNGHARDGRRRPAARPRPHRPRPSGPDRTARALGTAAVRSRERRQPQSASGPGRHGRAGRATARCGSSGSTRTCSAPTATAATCSCSAGGPSCAGSRSRRSRSTPTSRCPARATSTCSAAARTCRRSWPRTGCALTAAWPRRLARARWFSPSARAISCSGTGSAASRASRSRDSAFSTSPAAVATGAAWASWSPTSTRRSACRGSPDSRTIRA